ncbi:hypothetical protein PHSY_001524 [Pseudozyma hubeiensis SY62]|uniref:Zn(2)-C6 fungal-type domain-containing protein n=1 Tax=Pseudozyma hubeiensis (strain SY62) TaxID=1305764 RepID=R9P791_PSEHS|nr:hypothetical protein PHSY_001524 [Pseudozyma hubeiensis SY62]GAC93955.1 hypothetical protein PHSY_001524 [Pseudozyma hubeiensis SY62]
MSSPSVHAGIGPRSRSRSSDEPFVAPDQLLRDATQTDLACCASPSPQDPSNAKAQLVLRDCPPKKSPARSQDNRANDPHSVPHQVVLYLVGDQNEEDNRDMHRPSSSPTRAIVDWLATAGSAANEASSQDRRTNSRSLSSQPCSRKAKAPAALPPSPLSSVLEAFVDEMLGPEFARKEEPPVSTKYKCKGTAATAAANNTAKCDRCRSRKLKCVVLSKTGASCSNCRRTHVACTRNRLRVRGNQTPVPRPLSKKGPATTFHSSQNSVNESPQNAGEGRTTRSSAGLKMQIKSDSIDDDGIPSSTKRKKSSPDPQPSTSSQISNRNRPASASAPDPAKKELDGYTVGLLKDVMHALERVKGSLGESTALPALVPTLTSLEEGFDSMPRLVSEPLLSTVCTMLQRIMVQCLRKAKLQDQVEVKSAVWYTQSLVDRTLSCIKMLIDIE